METKTNCVQCGNKESEMSPDCQYLICNVSEAYLQGLSKYKLGALLGAASHKANPNK